MSLRVELSVIVPTFNEVDNIFPMIGALDSALKGIDWEVIFVDDDSKDGTVEKLIEACDTFPNVRRIHRIKRRGLSSAVVEGFQASTAPYMAVIDGDMQHDETKLKDMLSVMQTGNFDLVVGSRYVPGGGTGDWDESRVKISQTATKLSKIISSVDLSDPMSGFFMITSEAFSKAVRHLSLQGYKILLDIAASYPGTMRVDEVPYEFRSRQFGESKLDSMVVMEFLFMLIEKFTRGVVPAKFIMFGLVGVSGVGVHFAILHSLFNVAGYSFLYAQAAATIVAMTSNFFINNWLTYYDSRVKGWRILTSLIAFYGVCSMGAVANIGVANFVFEQDYTWWLSGFAGALVGSVWNYTASSILSWKK